MCVCVCVCGFWPCFFRPRFCFHRCFVFPGRPAYLRAALSLRAEVTIVYALAPPSDMATGPAFFALALALTAALCSPAAQHTCAPP